MRKRTLVVIPSHRTFEDPEQLVLVRFIANVSDSAALRALNAKTATQYKIAWAFYGWPSITREDIDIGES